MTDPIISPISKLYEVRLNDSHNAVWELVEWDVYEAAEDYRQQILPGSGSSKQKLHTIYWCERMPDDETRQKEHKTFNIPDYKGNSIHTTRERAEDALKHKVKYEIKRIEENMRHDQKELDYYKSL